MAKHCATPCSSGASTCWCSQHGLPRISPVDMSAAACGIVGEDAKVAKKMLAAHSRTLTPANHATAASAGKRSKRCPRRLRFGPKSGKLAGLRQSWADAGRNRPNVGQIGLRLVVKERALSARMRARTRLAHLCLPHPFLKPHNFRAVVRDIPIQVVVATGTTLASSDAALGYRPYLMKPGGLLVRRPPARPCSSARRLCIPLRASSDHRLGHGRWTTADLALTARIAEASVRFLVVPPQPGDTLSGSL